MKDRKLIERTPVVKAFSLAIRFKLEVTKMRVGVEVTNSLEKILISVHGY